MKPKRLTPKQSLKAEIKKLRDDEDEKELLIDTAGKTRKEIRQEKRKMRSDEHDQEKALKRCCRAIECIVSGLGRADL